MSKTASEQTEGRIAGLNEYGEGWMEAGERVLKAGRTCPGDKVRLHWNDAGKRFIRAESVDLLEASAERVTPACAAFDAGCGGCQWLHVAYARQLAEKQRIVADFINRRSRLRVNVLPVIGDPSASASADGMPHGFRNKMSLANVDGKPSFLKEYSTEGLVPEFCRVETATNQAAWAVLRQLELPPEVLQVHFRSAGEALAICLFVKRLTVRAKEFAAQLMATIPGAVGIGAASYHDYQHISGETAVEQELGGIRYRIPLNGFFQTNHRQAFVLRERAVDWLAPAKDSRVLDLYCGSGFFSLALAKRCERVVAIENNRESVAVGIENAKLNNLPKLRFLDSEVARGLSALKPADFSHALLDPPREGCEPEALRGLIRIAPRRLAYVSCSPETLGRDLRTLADAGYRLDYCQPVDMFPHTAHIELVVGLTMQD